MKSRIPVLLAAATLCLTLSAEPLPGFRLVTVGTAEGFPSSIAADSTGVLYLTTTDGWIHRFDGGVAVKVAALPTVAGGNGGLLGIALESDSSGIVHYTTWDRNLVIDDVVSRVDLATGAETIVHRFVADIYHPPNGSSSEHHGGNPTLATDGSIFVGIGDYGTRAPAQKPEWNGGKIWRIAPDGTASQWARGMRNPYDLAWDPVLSRVVVGDNGPSGGDEIHVIAEGANCGWPLTVGNEPQQEGTQAPDYVFESTIAPTGIVRLTDGDPVLSSGYLLGAFVTQAVYWFPDIAESPIADPVPIVTDAGQHVIDVTQAPDGTIYIALASFPALTTIARLETPTPGDCDGDGFVNGSDLVALNRRPTAPPSRPWCHIGAGPCRLRRRPLRLQRPEP
jgi:glucose/arabinose dehydrogenase